MNLICPHCQKTVAVADHLAGQTTKCPHCEGPFTVPRVESVAAAYSPRVEAFPLREEPPIPPPMPFQTSAGPAPPPPFTSPAQPQPMVPGEYQQRLAAYLSPKVTKWVTPACFLLLFFLTFFPWVGIYAGDKMLVRQSGWSVAFGSYAEFRNKFVGSDEGIDKPGWSFITLLYLLLILLGVAAAIAAEIVHFAKLPLDRQVAPWRSLALGGISLFALLFLLLQLLLGFSLEDKASRWADKVHDGAKGLSKSAPEGEKDQIKEWADIAQEAIESFSQRRFWLRCLVLLNFVAVVASLADFWLERRVGRPLPRMQLEW